MQQVSSEEQAAYARAGWPHQEAVGEAGGEGVEDAEGAARRPAVMSRRSAVDRHHFRLCVDGNCAPRRCARCLRPMAPTPVPFIRTTVQWLPPTTAGRSALAAHHFRCVPPLSKVPLVNLIWLLPRGACAKLFKFAVNCLDEGPHRIDPALNCLHADRVGRLLTAKACLRISIGLVNDVVTATHQCV
jgi:hypothetical protein